MTKSAIQPLESYRLVQYALPLACHVCGADNTRDAEHCARCDAPMALSHQTEGKKLRPRMVAIIGSSGAGKTVYLGMLMDMLSRQADHVQLLARGAFSLGLQQTTMAALARCRFPGKTPNEPSRWNWVHCEIRRPGRKPPVELIMPDMAGEAMLQEIEHPHSYRVVQSFLRRCSAAMVMIDAQRLAGAGLEQDFFTMKLLTYLSELDSNPRRGWKRRPVALVFTKADQCDQCRDDPTLYARDHAPGLWQHCRERFHRHRYFASGVAGPCVIRESAREGRVLTPLRIEPHGIVEPFLWLLEAMGDR